MGKNTQTLLLAQAAIILAAGMVARLYMASSANSSAPEQAPAPAQAPGSSR